MLNRLLIPETQAIINSIGVDNIRFVGGCVRDLIVGSEIKDIDFATVLTPEQMILTLKRSGIKTVPTGIKHGTITAIVNDQQFQITTLRSDISTDGRHAEVAFVDNWELDAQRRDFTINALYLSGEGKLFDFFGGMDHLRSGKVVFIGDAEARIREDYLRILRYFRFFGRFGQGAPDDAAARACSRYSAQVNYLSGERIQSEMFKILELKNCIEVMTHMQNYGILPFIFPGEVDFRILKRLLEIDPEINVIRRLAAIQGYDLQILTDHWRLNTEQYKTLKIITTNVDMREPRKVLRHLGRECFVDLVYLSEARGTLPYPIEEMLDFVSKWRIPKFPIYGGDVISLGVKEGRIIGKILSKLESYWEDHNYVFSRDELLKRLRIEVDSLNKVE